MTVTDIGTPTLHTSGEALAVAHQVTRAVAAGAAQRELDGVWPEEALRLVARLGTSVDPGSGRSWWTGPPAVHRR